MHFFKEEKWLVEEDTVLEIIERSRVLLEERDTTPEVTTNNFGLKNANAWTTPTHQISVSLLVEISIKMKAYD